jgi:hypothetical protein
MKKDRPRTPLATTTIKLKNSNRGLKENLRRVKSTEKKISSKINKEVRILLLLIVNKNTPRVIKIRLRLRNKGYVNNVSLLGLYLEEHTRLGMGDIDKYVHINNSNDTNGYVHSKKRLLLQSKVERRKIP